MEFLSRLLNPASDLMNRQPILALALGAALVAIFLSVALGGANEGANSSSVGWWLVRKFARAVWALTLVGLIGAAVAGLRGEVDRTLADFRHSHGRITEVNLAAVRTIWGGEQTQGNLAVTLGYEEEETERLESEDPTKPALLRKKTVHHQVTDNPFVSEHHEVTLRQSPRNKGSAIYAGYETECRFVYQLKNPADRAVKASLSFPLPSERAIFTDLEMKLNGKSVLDHVQVSSRQLLLLSPLAAGESITVEVAFKSRGLDYWYFQMREAREIRDFHLTLNLPDLPKAELNYPEGCMTPMAITPTADGKGTTLVYRLDHALSNKGMGVSMPVQRQPGATADAVLAQTPKAWVLLFAAMLLGLALTREAGMATLSSVLIGSTAALGYALIGDLSDTWFGFWGGYLVVLLPLLGLMAAQLMRTVHGLAGRLLALELLLFGLVFPWAAGFDPDRETLYLNLAAYVLLAVTAWQLVQRKTGQTAAS